MPAAKAADPDEDAKVLECCNSGPIADYKSGAGDEADVGGDSGIIMGIGSLTTRTPSRRM